MYVGSEFQNTEFLVFIGFCDCAEIICIPKVLKNATKMKIGLQIEILHPNIDLD